MQPASVIPAKAGIHPFNIFWTPAHSAYAQGRHCAGVTNNSSYYSFCYRP